MRRLAPALAALGLAVLPASAPAAWSPGAEVVSVDNVRLEQGDGATLGAAISGDGRYVVFRTRASNFYPDGDADAPGTQRRGGVLRYDRQTGALALVADGDVVDEDDGTLLQQGALNPSISDDGRWVAFSTGQRLVPADVNDNVDVYVRDMEAPIVPGQRASTGAYELVSALDGTDAPASYEPRVPPLPGRTPGTNVWPGTSISADGRYVAFRTVEQRSDLPDGGAVDTPPGAVLIRDVRDRRTVLVTRDRTTGEAVGGAFGPLSLSKDGTTVAWTGGAAAQQTAFLPGEGQDDRIPYYLWRRWADLGAQTRRVTGLVDVDDPACDQGSLVGTDPTSLGPCDGPLTDQEQGPTASLTALPPVLSGDGYTVAFLSGANLRPLAEYNAGLDLFLTDMRPGVSRKAGTVQLTRDSAASNARASQPIESLAMSADGRRIAFVTSRTQFVLPTPALQGAVRATPTTSDLYVVDRDARTIVRAVTSATGGDPSQAIDAGPSLSNDGSLIAFTSRAANLFAGDANEQADAFVTAFVPPPPPAVAPGGNQQPPGSFTSTPEPDPDMAVRATRRADGSVDVRVRVPAAGTVLVTAETRRVSSKRRATAAAARRLATGRATYTKAGSRTIRLRLKGADLRKARRGSSVPARLTVTYTPKVEDGRRLRERVDVTFRASKQRRNPRSFPVATTDR